MRTFILLIAILFFGSCSKVYKIEDADQIANTHQIIAIAPPTVSIAARKKVDAEAIKEQQRTESINFQNELFAWFLKRKRKGKLRTEIQDIQTTNAKLSRLGYFDDNSLSPAEICEALDVDGLVTSNFALSKPMSDGAAMALGLLVGVWGSTNSANATIQIHDAAAEKLIWNYGNKISGSVGSSHSKLINKLMRKSSRKMPYKK